MNLVNIFKNKELIATSLAQICQLLSTLLLLKLLTGVMTISGYGELALLLSMSAFILAFPFTAVQQGFFRYRTIYKSDGKSDIHLSGMLIGVTLILVTFIVIISLYILFFSENKYLNDNFICVILFIVTEVYKIYFRMIVNADRNRITYAISIGVEFSLKIFLCLIFSYLYRLDPDDVLAVYIFSNVMTTLAIFKFSDFKFCFGYNLEIKLLWRKVCVFSAPMVIWAAFGWLRDSSLRWFIDNSFTVNDVANFTALTSVSVIIPTVMQSLLSVYIVPVLYSSKGTNNEKSIDFKFKLLMRYLYIFGLLAFFFLQFNHELLVKYMVGDKYSSISYMLPVMFFGNFLFNCAMLNANILLANFKQMSLIWPNVLSGLCMLVYGFYILPDTGLDSLAFGYSAPYVVYFFVTYILVRRATYNNV